MSFEEFGHRVDAHTAGISLDRCWRRGFSSSPVYLYPAAGRPPIKQSQQQTTRRLMRGGTSTNTAVPHIERELQTPACAHHCRRRQCSRSCRMHVHTCRPPSHVSRHFMRCGLAYPFSSDCGRARSCSWAKGARVCFTYVGIRLCHEARFGSHTRALCSL